MLYVMSDIHGHLQRFESIMEQIKLGEGDHLFVLGDVIDRHPDGLRILQRLISMPNVQMILEPLGGGGNTATAGAQVKSANVKDTLDALVASIDNFYEE